MVAKQHRGTSSDTKPLAAAVFIQATSDMAAEYRIEDCIEYARDALRPRDWPDNLITRIRLKVERRTVAGTGPPNETTGRDGLMICGHRPDRREREGPDPRQYAVNWTVDQDDGVEAHLIAPTHADLNFEIVEYCIEHGVHVHGVASGIVVRSTSRGVTPDTRRAVRELIGNDDTHTADRLIDGIPHTGGRPPIGTRAEDGWLRAADDYGKVCRVLQSVADDEMTKVDAADALDIARRTIDNALERERLYRLD